MAIFGMMTLTRGGEMPERFRPLLPFGCMGMVLLTTVQFIGNQFGFDRDGFRVFDRRYALSKWEKFAVIGRAIWRNRFC